MKDKVEILRTIFMTLNRPSTYTQNGSLEECLSTITGFEMGVWNPGEDFILSKFPKWLNKKTIETNGSWVEDNPGGIYSLVYYE